MNYHRALQNFQSFRFAFACFFRNHSLPWASWFPHARFSSAAPLFHSMKFYNVNFSVGIYHLPILGLGNKRQCKSFRLGVLYDISTSSKVANRWFSFLTDFLINPLSISDDFWIFILVLVGNHERTHLLAKNQGCWLHIPLNIHIQSNLNSRIALGA